VIDGRGQRLSLAEYLTERASDVADRIDWLGRLRNSSLAELRRQAFITIVGSRYENFPLVVLEAAAYGCPLVATRTGGIAEIIEDGVNGVLARPGDPDDLAAAVLRLLEAPELAARLARQAGEDAALRYHPDAIARETAAFHQAVLDNRSLRTSRSY
jgi:1,4-alpha-glucan branching enzyme